jgi:hypothetical protein
MADQSSAWLIFPDGYVSHVTPVSGKRFELEELQAFVEGWIELVRLPNGQHMYVNEEAKLWGMEYNHEATLRTNSQHRIFGRALLMNGKRAS